MFQVIDLNTGAIVGTYTTNRQAQRICLRKGAGRYIVAPATPTTHTGDKP